MAVGVGDAAPDFTLPAFPTDHGEVSLAGLRGKPVVLVFYPGDDTPVCTTQLKSYNDDLTQFEGLGAQVLAVSPQSIASHQSFSCKHGFGFPLLADEDKKVFGAYGCLGPVGFPRRSVFVIDAGGTIRYAHRALAGLTYRKSPELLEAVKRAQGPG